MSSTRLLTFGDPYAYMSSVRAAEVHLIPTGKGRFQADLRQVTFQRLWMQRARESLPRISHSAVSSARVAIDFPCGPDQPSMWHNGLEVSPGQLVINDRNPAQKRTDAPSVWGSMSLSMEDFAAAARVYLGRDLPVPSVSSVLRPAPGSMSRLLALHGLAGRLASCAPERLAHPRIAMLLENALTHAFVRCLAESAPVETSRGQRHHTAIMAKLDDLLVSRGSQPLPLAALCAATGVSERTLRNCCQDRFGMGPVRYLWLRRMNLARHALLRADPAHATVTGIATAYGFWELGRFSVAYRGLFDERPSVTLNRPAGCLDAFDGGFAEAA